MGPSTGQGSGVGLIGMKGRNLGSLVKLQPRQVQASSVKRAEGHERTHLPEMAEYLLVEA